MIDKLLVLATVVLPALGMMVPTSVQGDGFALQTVGESETNHIFTVATSPPVPGFRVEIEGVGLATTNAVGVAVFELDVSTAEIRERIRALDNEIMMDDDSRYRFNTFQRFRRTGVTATFNVDYPVEFSFADRNGEKVAPERVDSLVIRSSVGQVMEVPPDEPIWLHGTRVLSNNIPKVIYWTVQSVVLDGASVVNRSAYRITPAEERLLPISLLIYDLDLNVRSWLFRRPIAGEVVLTHPDGETTHHSLENGTLHLTGLPRGEYSTNVNGGGLGVAGPVVLSRNQSVDLVFYTWFELVLVATAAILFLVLPVVIGLRARRRSADQSPRTKLRASRSP